MCEDHVYIYVCPSEYKCVRVRMCKYLVPGMCVRYVYVRRVHMYKQLTRKNGIPVLHPRSSSFEEHIILTAGFVNLQPNTGKPTIHPFASEKQPAIQYTAAKQTACHLTQEQTPRKKQPVIQYETPRLQQTPFTTIRNRETNSPSYNNKPLAPNKNPSIQ